MIRKIYTLLFLGLLALSSTTSKEKYPTDYFRSPVKHKLRLSGSFGELRSSHFHQGIDIKSVGGAVGDDILAAAEGYVVRIVVSPNGYGKALYLEHENGYTTVYGHLHRFHSELEAYIKSVQYERETFALDLKPEKGRFAFRKGQKIGVMGNTGSSGGPHLHFEIRDTETSNPINPLFFGLKVQDTRPPRMNQLRIYELSKNLETLKHRSFDLRKTGSTYTIRGGTFTSRSPTIGVALKTYDNMDGVTNWNGVYQIELYQEDTLLYRMRMEQIPFPDRRYINAHVDYVDRITKKSYYNRCYLLPGNQASIYDYVKNDGLVHLKVGETTNITVISSDIEGNESKASLKINYRPADIELPEKRYNYFLPYQEESTIDNGQAYLHFPEGSFYEDLYLDYRMSLDESSNAYSAVHHISNYLTPVHHYFDIAIRPTQNLAALKNKAFIGLCSSGGRIRNMGGRWRNNDDRLWAKSRTLGDYCIMLDTIPPTIKPSSFRRDLRGRKTMSFKITDNYAVGGSAKGLSYQATVDGKWILMEYDLKSRLIFHRFDGTIGKGEHQLRLEVFDGLGNGTVFERKFLR